MATQIINPDHCLVGVRTKFLGPTNHRGARIKATRTDHKSGDPTVTIGYDHALDIRENHAAAATALIESLGWDDRPWVMGSAGVGYLFVSIPRGVEL